MNKITNEQLDSLIKSAVNSSGPLPPCEKFSQIISALRELRELRAAMLHGAENPESPTTIQPAPALDSSPKIAESPSGNSPVIPDGLRLALSNAGIAAPESDEMLAATCEKYIQELVTWVKDRKPFRSTVNQDGWVILPAEPTQAMMNAWLSEVANWRGHAAGYRAMIAAAPQQEVK